MDQEERQRLQELKKLEEKYGELSDELSEEEEEEKDMPMQGASLRDVGRIQEKRKLKK